MPISSFLYIGFLSINSEYNDTFWPQEHEKCRSAAAFLSRNDQQSRHVLSHFMMHSAFKNYYQCHGYGRSCYHTLLLDYYITQSIIDIYIAARSFADRAGLPVLLIR